MTLEQLPLIMVRAFVLTVLIECAVVWCLGVRDRQDQITVVLANLMTNPIVVAGGAAVVVWIGYEALFPAMVLMEILVVLVEGLVYRDQVRARCGPFLLSLLCNGASYLIGEILNRTVF